MSEIKFDLIKADIEKELPNLPITELNQRRSHLRSQFQATTPEDGLQRHQVREVLDLVQGEIGKRVQEVQDVRDTEKQVEMEAVYAENKRRRRQGSIDKANVKLEDLKREFSGALLTRREQIISTIGDPFKMTPEAYAKKLGFITD